MITIAKLINIPIFLQLPCVWACVMRPPKIYSLSKFPVFDTIRLTMVTMLSLDLLILQNCHSVPIDHLPIPPPHPW